MAQLRDGIEMKNSLLNFSLCAGLIFVSSNVQASCGSAFCSVDTQCVEDHSKSDVTSSLDVRFEYVDQDQVRTKEKEISVGQIPNHHDEVRTLNQNLLIQYNRKLSDLWDASVIVPISSRSHHHIHNHQGGKIHERWSYNEFGDVQLRGRYKMPDLDLISGIKLPTGRTDVQNAEGDNAERSLQPGTGTIDWVVGINYHKAIGETESSWFVQALYGRPFNEFHHFEAGDRFTFDIGYKKELNEKWTGLFQINTQSKGRDRGSEGEPEDSGGRYVSLSPGATYELSPKQQIYGFYQRHVYQFINGVQLAAEDSVVLGLNFAY